METYDLSHKLVYAGARSPVPFRTGPDYTTSVQGVPVLAQVRVFIPEDFWSTENLKVAAREICRVLGATTQFDIGMARATPNRYDADRPAAGDTARLMKLSGRSAEVQLRLRGADGDQVYVARFPRLDFQLGATADAWREVYAPGTVKEAAQP